MNYMIGIDIGTTHLKACLLDEELTIVNLARADNRAEVSQEYGNCYDPEKFWDRVICLLKKIVPSEGKISAIGITGMADTGLPVDERGTPLHPIIPWNCCCGSESRKKILDRYPPEQLYDITGLPYHPKFAISRILYLWETQPEIMQKMRYWLSIYDYTLYRLTGEFVTDETQACRTMLFNIHNREWESPLTDFAGVTGKLPRVVGMGQIAGTLLPGVAKELGISAGIPVVCGGHDHLCAMVAAKVGTGEIFNSQGTSEVFVGFVPNGSDSRQCLKYGICQGCFRDGKRYWLANLPSSGASIEWLRRLMPDESPVPYRVFDDADRLTDSGGVLYLPMINGSGTPHPNPDNTGLLLGIRSDTTIYHLVKAIYEGISFETRWILDSIEEVFGAKIACVVAVGGGVKNQVLLQTRADVTGRPYSITPVSELTLYGAAIQAAMAVGFHRGAIGLLIDHSPAVSPTAGAAENYNSSYEKYRALYRDISPYLSIR